MAIENKIPINGISQYKLKSVAFRCEKWEFSSHKAIEIKVNINIKFLNILFIE